MPEKKRIKQIVAVLLPLFFLLVAAFAVYQWVPLKADDQNSQFVEVTFNGEKINADHSFTDEASPVAFTAEKTQVLKFSESDAYDVHAVDEAGNPVSTREVSVKELANYIDFTKKNETNEANAQTDDSGNTSDLPSQEAESIESGLFYVVEGEKKSPYLLIEEGQRVWLSVSNKDKTKDVPVTLEVPNTDKKQKLFHISPEKQDDSDASDPKATEEDQAGNDQTIKELAKKKYTEKDSFKPIELPARASNKRAVKSDSNPIAITGIKTTIKTGLAKFDTNNDNPGYDSSESNSIVRSFDSNVYLLSFSVEANNSDTTYSDINYRVEMELPNAYALDSHGKQRFNAEVVDNEHGKLEDTSENTKTSKGYVESTISDNGQIFLPMIVNTYGAEHGAEITPNVKITIISAKNNKSGEIEEMNLTYDENSFPELKIAKTTISAKPSVEAKLVMGSRAPIGTVYPYYANNLDNEIASVGVTLGLMPIDGRGKGQFMGATFPNGEVKVTIGSGSTYQKEGSSSTPVTVPTVASPNYASQTSPTFAASSTISADVPEVWHNYLYIGREMKIPNGFTNVNVPNGKSEQIHVVEPSGSVEEKRQIGVYDSGQTSVINSGLAIQMTNKNYTPIYNPYTYTLKGTKTNSNERLFSSSTLLVRWTKAYLNRKGTGLYSTNLKITGISYEGQNKLPNPPSQVTISDVKVLPGAWIATATYTKEVRPDTFVGLSSTQIWDGSAGDATVGKGEKNIYVGGASIFNDGRVREIRSYVRWNANSFEYDLDRRVYSPTNDTRGSAVRSKFRYGVGKTKDYPTLKHDTAANVEAQYNWYATPEQAVTHGKISAVKLVHEKKDTEYSFWAGAPIKVIGDTGQNDKFGNSNAAIYNSYFYNSSNGYVGTFPDLNSVYTPSVYDSSGTAIKPTNNRLGDSMFIKPFKIETTTTPDKPTYKTNEVVKWKVQGNLLGTTNTNYGVRLTTTLPKGIQYKKGTSVDGQGKSLEDPDIEEKSNGTTILVWKFSNVNPTKGSTVEVNFESDPIAKDLSFNNYSLATATTSTVGDMWLQSDPEGQKDTSAVATRTSSGKVDLYRTQQVVITKKRDKPAIEVGENDPVKTDNAITYTMNLSNESVAAMPNVRLVDVLPYNGDSRGSKFNGDYTVEDIKVKSTSPATIEYSNEAQDDQADPLTFTDGTAFKPGETPIEDVKDAKAIWVNMAKLAVDEQVTLTVTIKPNGQKAGDVYVNNVGMNSDLKLPVKSQNVKTTVYGRTLSGIAWYDDLADGLYGLGPNGTQEDPVKGIPVKLYRTSLEDETYKNELVKESLSGQSFIDKDGNSLIKTDGKGKYLFENLPEGDYIAEFEIDGKVYTVTKKLVGDDPSINSKADPETNKTDPYTQPKLSDLAKDKETIHHIPDVNIGLIRANASIRLFKYEAGTAIDANKDGELTDAEKATGSPLKGAVFDLYEGDKEKRIGSETTDESGVIRFDNLLPGDYTLIETKAPEGFELMKKPIKVTITETNQVIQLYQDNDKQTLLPEAGGTNPVIIGLLLSAGMLVAGFIVVMLYYRNPKQGRRL